MSENVSLDEIKTVLRQYVLIKGNDAINEALIDRVAHIMFKEFEIKALTPFALQNGPIDLSAFVSNSQTERPVERGMAAPTAPRNMMTRGFSETADVVASPVKQARPPRTHEEQIQEVEAERYLPPPPVPSREEREKLKPAEGQRAIQTAQQHHFSDIINKTKARIPENAFKSGALPKDYDAMVKETLNDQVGDMDEVVEEVSESSGGESSSDSGREHVVDVSDTSLQEMFGNNVPQATNPKDALALQRSLPRRMDSMGEVHQKGKNRSIARIDS